VYFITLIDVRAKYSKEDISKPITLNETLREIGANN
jgi:hypothetical protein